MIITLGGRPGTGKSVVARLLAKKLRFKHYSSGDFTRQIAEAKGISLLELAKIEETNRQIDLEVDKKQAELGKKEDNFIIDSRLGFHFIPHSKKIFLDADIEIRANRILNDKTRKENNPTLSKAKENIIKREKSELKRYIAYYKLNPYSKDNYDLVIDTTKSNPEKIADQIIDFVKNQK